MRDEQKQTPQDVCGEAIGNVARLFTRNCYAPIERRTSWAQPLNVSAAIRDELSFWLSNIDTINGRVMSSKSSAVGVVYSDASDSGFGGYFVQCGVDLVSGVWSEDQMHSSSTFREILAVKFVLLSLVNQLSGMTVKWFTDNQNVPRIISSGISKGHLQSEPVSIFNICCNYGISIEMEWIPRSQNDRADYRGLSNTFVCNVCLASWLKERRRLHVYRACFASWLKERRIFHCSAVVSLIGCTRDIFSVSRELTPGESDRLLPGRTVSIGSDRVCLPTSTTPSLLLTSYFRYL